MKISFERIEEWQLRFMKLNHDKKQIITDTYHHDELDEIIYILGNLLYFMHMTNKKEI